MKSKFLIFYMRFIYNFQNIKHFWGILMRFKDIKWTKDIFGIYKHFFEELPNKFRIEGPILNFCKHVVHKNSVMSFKISGFVGFTEWIFNLGFIKLTGT